MRLMKEENLTCKVKRSRYNSYKGEAGESKSNIIKRNFKAATANKKWATDVTEFKAAGKKLYLSAIIDMYNSEVISYSIAEKPNLKLVLEGNVGKGNSQNRKYQRDNTTFRPGLAV